MLVDIVGSVECPEKIIPSFVRLEAAKKRNDIVRNVFASAPDNILEIKFTSPEGEVGAPRVSYSSRYGDGVPSLIKGGPEVPESVKGKVIQNVGNCGAEFDLVKLVNAISVGLNSMGAWVIHKEFIDPSIKVVDVYLCARDSAL